MTETGQRASFPWADGRDGRAGGLPILEAPLLLSPWLGQLTSMIMHSATQSLSYFSRKKGLFFLIKFPVQCHFGLTPSLLTFQNAETSPLLTSLWKSSSPAQTSTTTMCPGLRMACLAWNCSRLPSFSWHSVWTQNDLALFHRHLPEHSSPANAVGHPVTHLAMWESPPAAPP